MNPEIFINNRTEKNSDGSVKKLITVNTPYNPYFPERARKLGGDRNGNSWKFDKRLEKLVRDAIYEVYGWAGNGTPTVDVVITLKNDADLIAHKKGIFIGGRQIARATGRDSGAEICEGVAVFQGDFYSGGSMKNWTTYSSDNCQFLVLDMYLPAFENMRKMPCWSADHKEVDEYDSIDIELHSETPFNMNEWYVQKLVESSENGSDAFKKEVLMFQSELEGISFKNS